MIKNPWPFNWRGPERIYTKDWSGTPCPYDLRHNLFCVRGRKDKQSYRCSHCYMRQQAMSYYQINRENVFIDRVCDRCGARIDNPDSMLYLLLENRKGEMVYNIEICRECVAEIADWLSGLELTDPLKSTGEELDDSIWG